MTFKVMIYNVHIGAIWLQTSDFLSDGNSNVCAISHHLWDSNKSNKIQKFDLEKQGQGEKWNLHYDRYHIGDFFSEFYLPGNIWFM